MAQTADIVVSNVQLFRSKRIKERKRYILVDQEMRYYVADRIKELCEKRNKSLYRLSKDTELTQTALGNIIKQKSFPTLDTIEKISSAFHMTVAQFLVRDNDSMELTEGQKNLLEMWNELDEDRKDIVVTVTRELLNKQKNNKK